MRIAVLFDLPTTTAAERRAATKFRNFLIKDGFDMLQYSVYTRICPNRDVAQKHHSRVRRNAPSTGSVRLLMLTEHQFAHMQVITGEKNTQEKALPASQLTFF